MQVEHSNGKRQTLAALFVMFLWGALYPLVKLGYRVCEIDTSSLGSVLMFAGVRFAVSGLIIAVYALLKGQRLEWKIRENLLPIAYVGLFQIVFHYACSYTGLTLTDSSKTAILKQLGSLMYVCFSFLFVKEEKFNGYKLLGSLLGFAGILAVNAGDENSGALSTGDILIICASVCGMIATIISKQAMSRSPAMLATGFSQLFGGLVLIGAACAMGGSMPRINISSMPVFAAICAASIISYCIWYELVQTGQLSHLFIIKFSMPIFASLVGAVLLGENILRWQYLLAFALITLGILCSHKVTKRHEESTAKAAK